MGSPDLGKRVEWKGDGAGRYLRFDCSNCSREEGYALIEAFDQIVSAEAPGSVRILADFEGGYHDLALTQRWKELHANHDRRVHRIACLGVVGSMKVVLAGYRFFVRLKGVDVDEKMKVFVAEEEALEWLLS